MSDPTTHPAGSPGTPPADTRTKAAKPPAPPESGAAQPHPATGAWASSFVRALDDLEGARDFAKARYQTELFRLAAEGLDDDESIGFVRHHARRFDAAGVFRGGPWERVDRLVPELVAAGLRGEGVYPTVEALSEIRLLSIAAGEYANEHLSEDDARRFLSDVMKLNLDLLYGEGETEEARVRPRVMARARRLFRLIEEEIPTDGLLDRVVEEIEQRAAQRPIRVDVLHRLVQQATSIPVDGESDATRARLDRFVRASRFPSASAEVAGSLTAYRAHLVESGDATVDSEVSLLGELLASTGLSSGFHAVLLRRVRRDVDRVATALGLSDVGRADLEQNAELVANLIGAAITPATCDAIHGLSQMLERSLLSRPEVATSLAKLGTIDLRSEVRSALLDPLPSGSGMTANGALIAGVVSVLGQPLGVGQGSNPTCVAARAISMWSLQAPGYLLEHLVGAARDGTVEIPFEGRPLRSDELGGGVAEGVFDTTSLDPVSRILVPHLDRIYDEMMRQASLRGEDPHKWVNPALYGRWVPNGFASIFDVGGASVLGYAEFVRLFFATHHPGYADHADLIYPNPVGIFVTDVHGQLLGYHAISIQRVTSDGGGDLRVYFFNPNNEGRQRWGRDVEPTVRGHGEVPGESSLPFEHFAAHLYAFHYNPYEVGDGFAVPQETIDEIETHARETWGRDFEWR
ncbi:MAG: hypothetical protein NXI30_02070 [bacterium]|nr:hypothetical protein [bacterium]